MARSSSSCEKIPLSAGCDGRPCAAACGIGVKGKPMSDEERPLFLVVTIRPRLDRLEEAEAQLQSMRRNSLQEPGCVFMHLVQPQDDPESWVMLEMFRSRRSEEHTSELQSRLHLVCRLLL